MPAVKNTKSKGPKKDKAEEAKLVVFGTGTL